MECTLPLRPPSSDLPSSAAPRCPLALRASSRHLTSSEVAASKYDLNYIGLDGSIGCMVSARDLLLAEAAASSVASQPLSGQPGCLGRTLVFLHGPFPAASTA
jgi:hypothetical protein